MKNSDIENNGKFQTNFEKHKLCNNLKFKSSQTNFLSLKNKSEISKNLQKQNSKQVKLIHSNYKIFQRLYPLNHALKPTK